MPKPSQAKMILPILQALDEAGGRGTPRQVADRLATALDVEPEARAKRAKVCANGGEVNLFDRDVRWARQRAKLRGWLKENSPRNIWELSDTGRDALMNAKPGVVVTVYETEQGVALWAEAEAAVGLIDRGTVQLVLTSTPYPLLRKKGYGNLEAAEHIDWITSLAHGWRDTLTDHGSLVLDLGDTWNRGMPTMNLWQERLLLRLVDEVGLHLAQRFYWENPSKMPSPAEWVTVRRVRVTPSVEQVYWLSKTPWPKADNRQVLRPYSDRMLKRIAEGGDPARKRPSGHTLDAGAFAAHNGGSIPHNLLTIPNTASNDRYQRRCKELGLPPHPARFPAGLPEFFVKFLTEPGDLCWDPMAGSVQLGEVAEQLGRRWIANDKSLVYLQGSATRFEELPTFTHHHRCLAVN